MCNCIDIEIGSYSNQILVNSPTHMPKENGYCIDRCIADEIMQLWEKGITTTGCCCGHNLNDGFIGVIDSDIPKMKELGYEVAFNPTRPEDNDSFKPKTFKQD